MYKGPVCRLQFHFSQLSSFFWLTSLAACDFDMWMLLYAQTERLRQKDIQQQKTRGNFFPFSNAFGFACFCRCSTVTNS